MTTFAVQYTYGTDTDALRDEHRPRHVEFLRGHFDAGRLRVSGPVLGGEHDGALLIWEAETAEELGALLDHDPFFEVGALAQRDIRTWNIVFGRVEAAR
jgi:uncharacterized protein YciI